MRLTLAIPTLNRFDLLSRCVASARSGTVPPTQVIIIDNSGGQCPPIDGASIVLGRQPQSVAKAWNDAVALAGGDWLILSNDDIRFAPDTIECMLDVAEADPRAGVVSPIEGQRFSCFLLRYAAWIAMDGFDEGYEAAYFEDNHADRLLRSLGWDLPVAPSAVGHVGSATLKAMDARQIAEKHRSYAANQERYIRLWGGPPHHEVHDTPREDG